MTEVKNNEIYTTQLKDETFLRFVDNSTMGVLIIQRGFLQYFNKQFTEIFGYSKEDILTWKKREFYNIVHPDDRPNLIKNFEIQDDKKTVIVHFRGVRKDNSIINIENYNCAIKYNNKFAVLSCYVHLEESATEMYVPKLIKTKEERLISLKYNQNIIKLLEDNKIDFEIIKHYSYREEK